MDDVQLAANGAGISAVAACLYVSLVKDMLFSRTSDVQPRFVKPLWQQTNCCAFVLPIQQLKEFFW